MGDLETKKPLECSYNVLEGYNQSHGINKDLDKKSRLKLVTLTGCLNHVLDKNGIDPSLVSILLTTQNMIYEIEEEHEGEHVLNSDYFLLTRDGPQYIILIEKEALEGGVPGMVLGWIFMKAGLRIVETEKGECLFIFPTPILELDYLQSLMDEIDLIFKTNVRNIRWGPYRGSLKALLGG